MPTRWDDALQKTVDDQGHWWDSSIQKWRYLQGNAIYTGSDAGAASPGPSTLPTATRPAGSEPVNVIGGFNWAQLQQQVKDWANKNAIAMAGVQANLYGSQLQHQAAMAAVAQNKAAADQQYDVDLKNFGLAVATFNYNKRIAQVNTQLADAMRMIDIGKLQKDVAALNFEQRTGVADRKAAIMQMLADRSGPQDWLKYNSLLNQLSPPTPEASTTIDPFSILDGLDKPFELDIPDWAKERTPFPEMPDYVAPPPAQPSPAAAPAPPAPPAMPVMTPPPPLPPGATGSGGAPAAPPATGATPASWSGVRNEDVANAGPGWEGLTGMAGPSAVGDYTAWDVWDPTTNTRWDPNKPIPAGARIRLQRKGLARGGEVGPNGLLDQIGPVMVGDDPEGQPTGREELAMVENPGPATKLKVQPMNPEGMLAGAQQGGGGDKAALGMRLLKVHEMVMKMLSKIGLADEAMGGEAGPPPEPGLLGAAAPPVGPPGMPPMPGGPNRPPMPMQRAATGGDYGTDASAPWVTWNRYDPSAFGNLAVIQKAFGKRRAPAFQGFGAKLSNPQYGIDDAPSLLNLQAYGALANSEQKMLQDVYGKGLSVDWEDILGRAIRAAPIGRGNPTAQYGS